MGIFPRILRSWRSPRVVMREILAAGTREDRALATLVGAALLLFVAQWPIHARAAHLDPSIPLDARIGGALMGAVFLLMPLAYLLAAISHWLCKALGGQGSHYRARMALFWALLAVGPFMLLNGLVGGFVDTSQSQSLVSAFAGGMFLLIWGANLRVAEFEPEAT